MDYATLATLCREYREYKRIKEQAEDNMSRLAEQIKAAMGDSERLTVGEYKVSNTRVESRRLDTAAVKKQYPEVAEKCSKMSVYFRFSIT